MKFSHCVVLLAVLVCSGGSLALEKGDADPRLEKKITYEAKGKLVHDVLEELTKQTGVVMRCGGTAKDWQVRDRKVTIFVKDMPLGDFQKHLASLLHFTWTTFDGSGPRTYRLVQSVKQKQEEAALRQKTVQEEETKQAKRRESALASIETIGSVKPEDLPKLKDSDPWRYILATEPIGKCTADLLKAVPEVREALATGQELTISVSKLSPEAQESAKAFGQACSEFGRRMIEAFAPPHAEAHGDSPEVPTDPVEITVNGHLADMNEGTLGFVAGEISVDDNMDSAFPLLNADTPVGKMICKMLASGLTGGGKLSEAEMERIGTKMMDPTRSGDTSWFIKLPADDPDLDKVIKLDLKKLADPEYEGPEVEIPEELGLPRLLGTVADNTDLQILSDHFRPEAAFWMPKEEQKLRDLLEGIALAHGKQVKKIGKTIVFQDHQWPENRSWEVAEDTLVRWRKAVEAFTFSLDDAAAMACLSAEQIEHTIVDDDVLNEVGWQMKERDTRSILQLYGSLTADQRRFITDSGMDIRSMSPEQMATLQAATEGHCDRETLAARPAFLAADAGGEQGHCVFVLFDPTVEPNAPPVPSDIAATPDAPEPRPGAMSPTDEEDPSEIMEEEDPSILAQWSIMLPRPTDESAEDELPAVPPPGMPAPPGAPAPPGLPEETIETE